MGKNNSTGNLSWEHLASLEEMEDSQITFLLYQEGKSLDLISRIRNLPKEVVQEHILKVKMNKSKNKEQVSYHPSFLSLLAADKNNRIKLLESLSSTEKESLSNYLKRVLATIDNADDKMIALWIAGQLQDPGLLPVIWAEMEHKHGGVRRMVCSALRKIPHPNNIDLLHRGLQDSKPQVRQYAAKALGEIGDERTLKRLKSLLNNPKEMDYVKKSYLQTIEIIEKRK